MLMFTLLILLLAAAAMYKFILWFNNFTRIHARYAFFTMEHSVAMVFSYALIYFGKRWIHTGDDSLNGTIVMGIGILLLLSVMMNNFRKAPRLYAIAGSLAQLIFYVPISIGAVILAAAMLAWFVQTKPVYVINND